MPDRTLGTRFESAADSPGLRLWQATNRWQALMRAALAPHDLTHVQYVLLASLVWLGEREADAPITQAALADQAATDVMMTSQVLRALERKGLLVRGRHPTDGRARVLTPTPAGVQAARGATADVEHADALFFDRLTDVRGFTAELARLATAR